MKRLSLRMDKVEQAIQPQKQVWLEICNEGETETQAQARCMARNPQARPTDEFILVFLFGGRKKNRALALQIGQRQCGTSQGS